MERVMVLLLLFTVQYKTTKSKLH